MTFILKDISCVETWRSRQPVPESGALGLRPAGPESCARGPQVGSAGSPQGPGPAAAPPLPPSHLQQTVNHSDVTRWVGRLDTTYRETERESHLGCDRVQCYCYGNQVCVRAGGMTSMGRLQLHFLFHSGGCRNTDTANHKRAAEPINVVRLVPPSADGLTFPPGTGHDG